MGARPLPPEHLRRNDGRLARHPGAPPQAHEALPLAAPHSSALGFRNKTIFGRSPIFRYSFSKNIAMMMALEMMLLA
jgi:hypothetical protein